MTRPFDVARTGPAVRRALSEIAPQDCVEFEAEFRIALAETDIADDFDLSRVTAVIDKWRGVAYMRMYPITEEERAALQRFRSGDETGLYSRTADGGWVRHGGALSAEMARGPVAGLRIASDGDAAADRRQD